MVYTARCDHVHNGDAASLADPSQLKTINSQHSTPSPSHKITPKKAQHRASQVHSTGGRPAGGTKWRACRPQACSVLTSVMASVSIMPVKPSMAALCRWRQQQQCRRDNSRLAVSNLCISQPGRQLLSQRSRLVSCQPLPAPAVPVLHCGCPGQATEHVAERFLSCVPSVLAATAAAVAGAAA